VIELSPATKREVQAAAIALLASVAVGSILMLIYGVAPGHVWLTMIEETTRDPNAFGEMLYKSTSLVMCGLSVAIALDAGLFNIGAEGQMTAGILTCAVVGSSLPADTPSFIGVPLCLLAAASGGAMVGWLIGFLRARRNAHEVITSIMLNYVVAGLALWVGNAVLFRGGTTRGGQIAGGAQLPALDLAGSAANTSIVIAVIAIGVLWWLRSRTTLGHAWRAVGHDPDAARSVGISVGRVQIMVMTGAGALAGLAAANFVMGHKHAFEEGLGRNTGFIGISVALLGRANPIGVAFAAIALGFLSAGGLTVGHIVPKELTEMLQGVVVLAIAASTVWVHRRALISEPKERKP
jgi:simple sugar transport system permease protein